MLTLHMAVVHVSDYIYLTLVWAMPGGFTGGRDGYQNVDDEVPVHHPRATVPPPAPPAAAQTAPGAYQTV